MKRSPPIRCHCSGPCAGTGSLTEYAKHADVTKGTVTRWRDDGKIPVLADGHVDFTAADDARKLTVGSSPGWAADDEGVVEAGGTPVSYAAAQARHETAKARLAELKVAEAEGRLVPAADVEREWFRILRAWRNRFLALPSRLAGGLAAAARKADDDALAEHEVRVGLDREIHDALEEIAAKAAAGGEGEGLDEKSAEVA